jgi:arginine decarboxylase
MLIGLFLSGTDSCGATMPDFGREDAISLYNVDRWSGGYFTVNKAGNIVVLPNRSNDQGIDLTEIVEEAKERKLDFPLMVRFHDLLRDRVETINKAFADAMETMGYRNVYRGVFPIKVNQLREVVEEILDAGKRWHFGIEAGSKPELVAALAFHNDFESLIICNGYKDTAFIRNALLGRKLGKTVILIVEKLEELTHILEVSSEMQVEPDIGLRVRLLSKGAGKWATSGGENAKFGLSTSELVAASDLLTRSGLAHALKLVHFHVGSQVPDIGTIKRATKEAARFYSKLWKMGHGLGYLDVGGGLAVDYDGSRTAFDSSTNYSLNEYARDIVYSIKEVCDAEGVPHPTIISESGRAIVAHHSVLIVEAFGSIEKSHDAEKAQAAADDSQIVHDIIEICDNLGRKNRLENLHDAQEIRERAQSMFDLGLLDLRAKARIETAYWQIAGAVVTMFRGMRYVPEEVKELEVTLGDQFLCNFSVFQSLLDHWAVGQLFPAMPIHRLNELPDRNATLVDITCDSGGKVSKFVDLQDVKETLPLHRWEPGDRYYIGFFLVGAYQDIMGDLHNLFGRVNEMHIYLDEDEDCGYYVEEVLPGSTIGQVLSLTQWDTNEIARLMKAQVDAAIKSDRLKPSEAMRLLDHYEKTLASYTYLNFDDQRNK